MVTELKEFTDKEIHEFTSFSKTYYNNIETTDYELIIEKFKKNDFSKFKNNTIFITGRYRLYWQMARRNFIKSR